MKNRLILGMFTAGLVLVWRGAIAAESYSVRPTCEPSTCNIKPGTYGYNDTWWRQWPTQYRPEVSDPRAIGATRIPTPPPVPEVKLPPGGSVPSKPSLPSALPGTLLPPGVPELSTSGAAAMPREGSRGTPGDRDAAPSGGGTIGIPGFVLPPTLPQAGPGGEGSGSQAPSGLGPSTITPKPAEKGPSTAEPPRSIDLDRPDLKLPGGSAPKIEEPSTPKGIIPITPLSPSGAVRHGTRAVAAQDDLPSLPDAPLPAAQTRAKERFATTSESAASDPTRDRQLQAASFEQRGREARPPLRRGLDGYCPVELLDKQTLIAGRTQYRVAYDGQIFHFSSAAALKQFSAVPEKYAPVHSGNDAVLAVEENRTVPGSIQHSAVWRGRLYLFASSANLTAFREDPTRYLSREQPEAAATPEATATPETAPKPEPQKLQLPADPL